MNKNKTERTINLNNEQKNYRERQDEILFMDLRQIGEPFEKKYIQFSDDHIQKIASTYHNWQQLDKDYEDVPEFCYSAKTEEVIKKDYSLVPSKYIEFINRDENIDFGDKMTALQSELSKLLQSDEQSKKDLLNVFKELDYDIEL